MKPYIKALGKRKISTGLTIFALIVIIFSTLFFAKFILAEDPGIAVNPTGYTNIDRYTFSITGDLPIGATRYQYRTGADDPVNGWVDTNPVLSDTITIPNVDHPGGYYQEGDNNFYFRALDSGDNIIEGTELSKEYFYSTRAPSYPTDIQISPNDNTLNSFTISWDPPDASSFLGDPNKITYYYSIGSIPTPENVVSAGNNLSIGPSPFAVQVGENRVYLLAKDEAGNIDYNNYSSPESFYAYTTAPPIPTGIQIDDISSKDTEEYRLVISWTEPEIEDPGNFNGYDIYESSNESGPFNKLANTTQNAYVHTGITKDSRHYYYVTATDKTGNTSAPSEIVNEFATGRYTHPPAVTKETEATPKSSRATITWVTERAATSSIEFGKTNSLGMSVGDGIINYVTDHSVTVTNLEPNTTYYYKAVFIDPDGNVGQTEIKTFKTEPSPIISNLNISEITTNSMLVTWETNKKSSGEVRYGTSQSYGSVKKEGDEKTLKHSEKLTNLNEGTLYHIQITETDDESNVFYSDDYKKETLPMPKVFNILINSKSETEVPTITIKYDTNIETTTYLTYEAEGIKTTEYFDSEYTKNHMAEITNLKAETKYYLKIGGQDILGNECLIEPSEITTLSDTLPPKVLSQTEKKKVSGTGEGADSILTIKVTTNEPTTAVAEAIKGISEDGEKVTSEISSFEINHTIIIKLQHQATPYNYTVKLRDSEGNETITTKRNIISPKKINTPLDFLAEVFINKFNWLSNFIKI